MADWNGTCRSNYVRVKDETAFRALLGQYDVEIIADAEGRLGFYSQDEFGGLPTRFVGDDEATGDDEQDIISLLDEPLAEHLAEGECLVVMEVGAEKARYLTGLAFAFRWDGETKRVSLSDIYEWCPPGTTEATY